MAKKKRHKKHEDHIDESWLVPYADILTLLLALFIVLFASSSVDQEKMEKMSEVFNEIFDSGEGLVKLEAPVNFEQGKAGNENVKEPMSDEMQQYIADKMELEKIKEKLDEVIETYNLSGQFETKLTDEGLLITIRDSVLFELGSAEISTQYEDVIKELARILEFKPERNMVITGHTDNLPLNNEIHKSNWELSVDRAANFMKLLTIYNPNLDVTKMSSKGFGEIEPLATNETSEGRALNRRVELLIQPNVAYKKEFDIEE